MLTKRLRPEKGLVNGRSIADYGWEGDDISPIFRKENKKTIEGHGESAKRDICQYE